MVRIETETKMFSNALKHGVVVGSKAPHSTKSEVDDAAKEPERAQEVGDHGWYETQPCMKQSVPFQQVPVQRVANDSTQCEPSDYTKTEQWVSALTL